MNDDMCSPKLSRPIHHIWAFMRKKLWQRQVTILPIEIVRIHAAFLSIIVGVFSAYYLYAYSEIRKVQRDAFTQAETINTVNFARSPYFPRNENYFAASGPDDISSLQQTVMRLVLLTADQPGGLRIGQLVIPEDSAERAKQILGIMNIISHRYPFPKAIEGSSSFRPEPIQFNDVKNLHQWLNDVESIITFLKPITHFLPLMYENHPFKKWLNALALREKDLIERAKSDKMLQVAGEPNPFYLVNDFIRGMLQVDGIVYVTRNSLARVDYLQAIRIPKFIAVCILIGGFLVFLFGIFCPLIEIKINPLLYLYLPLGYYAAIFLILAIKIIAG
jgi:hypothetical protein